MIWAYFFIRYSQYFIQEGWHKLFAAFSTTLDIKSAPKIKEIVTKKYPRNIRENCGFYTLKNWDWVYHGQEKVEGDGDNNTLNNFTISVSPRLLWKEIVICCLNIIFIQSASTDYMLHFLIALFTLIYAL